MRRIPLAPLTPWAAAALLALGLAGPARAGQDDALRHEIAGLGQITGDEPLEGALAGLLKDKDHARQLLAAGVKMAQDKDPQLTYNGALVLALAAKDAKDVKSAEPLFRVCMDQAAKLLSQQKIFQSYGGLFYTYYAAKQYADATRVCREVLELKTGDGKPRTYVFPIVSRLGEPGFEEDESFDVTKRLRPLFVRLMIGSMTKEGKYDQALKLVDNLVRNNDHWEQRELRGEILREAGRVGEAAKVYEDVLERVAKDKDIDQKERDENTERFRQILSSLYVDSKQIDKATEHLKALIASHPGDPGGYNDLGYIWADNDMHLKEAEEMVRKALDLDRERRKKDPKFKGKEDRENGAYLDSLGWVLYKKKEFAEAKKYLQKALEDKDSQHLEIYDHLGDVCLALGDREAALNAWRRGLEIAGDSRRERERKVEVEKKIQKVSGK